MRQLELQQEREERELLERGGNTADASTATPDSKTTPAPVRSRSGNDLTGFNSESAADGGAPATGAANLSAKSMPGSRRHSGEVVEGEQPAAGKPAAGKDGQPMLNSFLFDDELDQDLQSECQSASAVSRAP